MHARKGLMKRFLTLLLLPLAVHAQVRVESLPEPGLQPQVAVSPAGVVHLVYLLGDPKACDVRYTTRRLDGGDWTPPVTVNSEPRSAIAVGTIRGAQIALGRKGSVQVLWNGSTTGQAERRGQAPLLHARLAPGDKAFSAQRNLMGDTTALDGGASITANGRGRVSVVWHAAPSGAQGEADRLVLVRDSSDDGLTFAPPTPLNEANPGVCACCSLRAHLTEDDRLSVLYRGAPEPASRGMLLLTRTAGRTRLTRLDDWRVAMCPMSSASLLPTGEWLQAAWEKDGRIVTGRLDAAVGSSRQVGPKNAKHPVLARNSRGQTLVACVIGSGWNKAGTLHWDLLDEQGLSTASGGSDPLPLWSHTAVYTHPDGSFVLLH